MNRRRYLGLLITGLAGCGGSGDWQTDGGGKDTPNTTVPAAADPGTTTRPTTPTRTDTPTDTATPTEAETPTDTATPTETDTPTTTEEPNTPVQGTEVRNEHLETARSALASLLEEYASYSEGRNDVLGVTATIPDFPTFVGNDQLEEARAALDAAARTTTTGEATTITQLRALVTTFEAMIQVQAAIVEAHDDLSFGVDRLPNDVRAALEWHDRAMETRNEASDAFDTLEAAFDEDDARALPALRTDIYARKHEQLVVAYESFEEFGDWLTDVRRGIDYVEQARQQLDADEEDVARRDAERAIGIFERLLEDTRAARMADSMQPQVDIVRSVAEEWQQEAQDLEDDAS